MKPAKHESHYPAVTGNPAGLCQHNSANNGVLILRWVKEPLFVAVIQHSVLIHSLSTYRETRKSFRKSLKKKSENFSRVRRVMVHLCWNIWWKPNSLFTVSSQSLQRAETKLPLHSLFTVSSKSRPLFRGYRIHASQPLPEWLCERDLKLGGNECKSPQGSLQEQSASRSSPGTLA